MNKSGEAVATRESQIPGSVNHLDKEISVLRESIDRLENRLSTVLVPLPPQPPQLNEKIPCIKEGPLCPIATRIVGLIEQVRSLHEAVDDMMNRCEC